MTRFKKIITTICATAALSLSAMTASAALLDIDITGIESWDGEGSGNNTVLVVDLGLGNSATVDGFGWDVTISTVGASWLSEAVMGFRDNDGDGIDITPGFADNGSGNETYSSGGILDLTDNLLPDIFLLDGFLRIEFFEGFDDVEDAIDAIYGGFITVSYTVDSVVEPPSPVSAPGIIALFGLGVFGVMFARRR